MTKNKIPCKNCITFSICQQIYKPFSMYGYQTAVLKLLLKCSLLREYLSQEIYFVSSGANPTNPILKYNIDNFPDRTKKVINIFKWQQQLRQI